VDADADLDLGLGELEARRPGGTVQALSATPMLRTLAMTRSATEATEARSSPRSAAAPAIFSTATVPATPRRPAV